MKVMVLLMTLVMIFILMAMIMLPKRPDDLGTGVGGYYIIYDNNVDGDIMIMVMMVV